MKRFFVTLSQNGSASIRWTTLTMSFTTHFAFRGEYYLI